MGHNHEFDPYPADTCNICGMTIKEIILKEVFGASTSGTSTDGEKVRT